MMKALIPTLALLILNLADSAPTKRYRYSGNGADAHINWHEQDCDIESSTGFWAGNYVTKEKANGEPETTSVGNFVDPSYERFYNCSNNKVNRTYLSIDTDATPSRSVVIRRNLKSASVSSTFQAWIENWNCGIDCEIDTDEDGQTTTDCSLMDCEVSSSTKAELTLKATLVGTGPPDISIDHFHSHDSYGSSYHWIYSGLTRNATVSAFTLTVGGAPMLIPSDGDKSASIFRAKSGSLTITHDGI